MPDFTLLGSLMRDLHSEFVRMYYLLLPIFFSLSVMYSWFKSPRGGFDFLDTIKRALVSMILLIAFPDISHAITSIADGVCEKIDHLSGLDAIIRMAQEKAKDYSFTPKSILLQFNDLLIATLSFLSYLVLYVARYLTIALYYFFWTFFVATAPLLILFHLFEETSVITKNLFKGMMEVASWKICWAILGAMLTSLSFGDAYKAEGNYLTLIVMNFVISIAMLMTPLIVRSLVGSGVHTLSQNFSAAGVMAMASAPMRAKEFLSGQATRSIAPHVPAPTSKSNSKNYKGDL